MTATPIDIAAPPMPALTAIEAATIVATMDEVEPAVMATSPALTTSLPAMKAFVFERTVFVAAAPAPPAAALIMPAAMLVDDATDTASIVTGKTANVFATAVSRTT